MPRVDPDRWRALDKLLDDALDLPNDQRPAWLAAIAEGDATMAAELAALLAEEDKVQQSGFLTGAVSKALHPTAPASLAGQIVGAYRLVAPLGQGGMGSVWRAERADGRFEGRAAVKLLNVAFVGRAVEGRFRREGTILAKVTHPHIAHLIDAGVTPAGQPYLVLELVEGQHIDRYCRDRGLGVDARLRLFLDVLEAVAHAHANLIIHRDIKPGNVLVREDGQVKLLDFGIATLLASDVESAADPDAATTGGTSALTQEAGTALTPQFAAPEQLSQGPVTTSTDVYALGVLLYVLLTGRHPAGESLKSHARLVRAIVDEEPRRMSEVVDAASDADALERHAAERGTTPHRLRRTLRGDLDTIVAKALKKAPAERYASVTAMADDLRRYLSRAPISARPDTLRYRVSKFVGRHKVGVAASTAAVVAMASVVGFYTARLSTERDRAQREAEKAAKVSEALTGLLMGADPISNNRATQEGLTVRGLLDAGYEQARRGLVDNPEAQADIFGVLGRLYRRYGVYDRAQGMLEQALASGERVFGPVHLKQAQTLTELGALLTEKGDYVNASASLERALEMRRSLLGTEHADVAVTMVELGRVYQDRGLYDRAEPLQRDALAIRQRVLGPEDRETAVSLSALGSDLRLRGDLVGAESVLRQCLAINRKTRGETHANTGTTMHDLGLVFAAKGDLVEAESQFRRSMDITAKALGEGHPTMASALNGLAHVWTAQGKHDEAAGALERAVEIATAALGAEHQLVAIYGINLAAAHLARKRPDEAEPVLRESLRIRTIAPEIVPSRRRTFIEDDWSVGAAKSLLGAVLLAERRYEEAASVLLEARYELEGMPVKDARAAKVNDARLQQLAAVWRRPNGAVNARHP
jgi:eukaryotic-like serine/threonine-protein kinase